MEPQTSPEFDVVSFFPDGFFQKKINEPFIQRIMAHVTGRTEWQQGNPLLNEPDYFCGTVPFEFTLASDKKKKENYIQRLTRGLYTTSDAQADAFRFIEERIQNKAEKKYSVSNVHLCVFCLIDQTEWVSDLYGSRTHTLFDYQRSDFFALLRKKYIDTGFFTKIFIIFPDWYAKWWVYDIVTDDRNYYQITAEEIRNGQEPFELLKSEYERLLVEGNRK